MIKLSEAPYVAAIFYNRNYFCSGSLISENFVLSAAHCFANIEILDNYQTRIGSVDISKGGVLVKIEEIIIHPNYKERSRFDKDFSLLRLEDEIDFSSNVGFAKLPSTDDAKAGAMTLIGGWGRTEYDQYPQFLLGAKVPIYDTQKCKDTYGEIFMPDTMICAGYEEGKVDACDGN